jgi:dethiobiotin synthetase
VRLFVTGTDTNVGKTYCTALLLRALRRAGKNAVGFKPICCGGREDAEVLHAAAEGELSLNEVNPVWLRTPAAPYAAALVENRSVDLALIRETFSSLEASYSSLLVEGVGGWRVPITADYCTSDLAAEFGFPVAIVVANRLGALNHTLLTLESIRAGGLTCAGLILNHVTPLGAEPEISTATNRAILEMLVEVPVLFEISHRQEELSLPS